MSRDETFIASRRRIRGEVALRAKTTNCTPKTGEDNQNNYEEYTTSLILTSLEIQLGRSDSDLRMLVTADQALVR